MTSPDSALAEQLETALEKSIGCKVIVSHEPQETQALVSTNQQRILWDLAKEVKASNRASNSKNDYTLYVDGYSMDGRIRFIHMIVCDRNGEWVLVDYTTRGGQ